MSASSRRRGGSGGKILVIVWVILALSVALHRENAPPEGTATPIVIATPVASPVGEAN